jgi:flavodoxin
MADILIFYHSVHHQNTLKLLEGIKKEYEVDLVSVPSTQMPELLKYKAVGFASGIYMSDLDKSLYAVIEDNKELLKKKCFLIFTSGSGNRKSENSFMSKLKEVGADVIGSFGCRGYDTYGPFKFIGGIAKKHPNDKDIENAVQFMRDTVIE